MILIAKSVPNIEYYQIEEHEVIKFGNDILILNEKLVNCNKIMFMNKNTIKVERTI